MSSLKPTWKRLGERTAYKGRVHIVEHDIELPNGEQSKTDWPIHVFYCDDYVEVAKADSGDTSEQVERIQMSAKELQDYMDSFEIVDPSLLIGWNIAVNKGYFNLGVIDIKSS